MSDYTPSSASTDPIAHNVYFEGKVQSLGLETSSGKATLGVMKAGSYTFSASSPEQMVIVSGVLHARLPEEDFKRYAAQETFDVAAGTSFEVKCEADVAYICYYG